MSLIEILNFFLDFKKDKSIIFISIRIGRKEWNLTNLKFCIARQLCTIK